MLLAVFRIVSKLYEGAVGLATGKGCFIVDTPLCRALLLVREHARP